MPETRTIRAVLAGNPNSGKSTLFNNITGAHQHVGNYPGVTVERHQGQRLFNGTVIELVDLPGAYSVSAFSDEERVARDCLEAGDYDLVVNIIDASNLDRNLFLTLQLKEMGVPLMVVLNMVDIARKRGIIIDTNVLSERLGVPVVETVGYDVTSVPLVLDSIIKTVDHTTDRGTDTVAIAYDDGFEAVLADFQKDLIRLNAKTGRKTSNSSSEDAVWSEVCTPRLRWTVLKLLERDDSVIAQWKCEQVDALIVQYDKKIEELRGYSAPVAIAAARFDTISQICIQSVRSTVSLGPSISDQVDSVLTHRWWGVPIFLFLMYLVFQLTFTLGAYPMEWIETGFSALGSWLGGLWPEGSDSLLKSLLVDGVIGGVGGVIIFLPNILLLFLAISILEDSGYMARAVYLTDRFMHLLGLHGKSFIPMIIGFGCSVPAIMATRTLPTRKDRLITMFVVPLMSCGARLPIYALLIPAFFPLAWQAPVMWGLYCLGILTAVVLAKILSLFILREEDVPFIIELPPYHFPTFRTVGIHTLERGWLYLKKAGTVILGISIVLWALTTFPRFDEQKTAQFESQREAVLQSNDLTDLQKEIQLAEIDNTESEEQLVHSYAGRIGRVIEPVLVPMGFDWKIGTALIGAFAAKEVFVAQMGIVYRVGEADEESLPLREVIRRDYSPLVGLGIMIFCLLSSPCMATVAVMAREAGSWKWALAQWLTLTGIAWLVVTVMYQLGVLFQIGVQ